MVDAQLYHKNDYIDYSITKNERSLKNIYYTSIKNSYILTPNNIYLISFMNRL